MKPKVTEEFLWKMNKIIESIDEIYGSYVPHEIYKKVLRPELERIRTEYNYKKRKKNFLQFVSYLKQKGYIKIPQGRSVYDGFQFTGKGKEKALRVETISKLKPRKDGKMIMIMYDIPKEKEKVRYIFRGDLKFLDYKILQKSIWVSDKDVIEETKQILKKHKISNFANIFIIESIGHTMLQIKQKDTNNAISRKI